jgi:N-acetylneuraminic acid mutarotase
MEFRTPGKESVYEQLPFGWSTDFTCPRSRPGMSSGRMISLSIATRRWIGFVALGAWATTAPILASPRMDWTRLPSLPNAEGFAGMYAGVGGGSLIAAGGTQFANGVPWWDGGKKIWSDAIYVLEPNAKLWRVAAEKLPHVLGDGGSVTHRDRLICIGGGDEARGSTRVFALQVVADRVVHTDLPALPEPALKLGAAVMGDTLYIIGGRDDPNSQTATRALRSMDLARPDSRWQSLPDCPGPGRIMPIVVVAANALYVFGGIEIRPDNAGRAKNIAPYLQDAWRYIAGPHATPGKWERLASLPQPLAGSPSPAWLMDPNTILICGGVDGAIEAITDRSSIRTLPGKMVAYHIRENRWTAEGEMPAGEIRVNAPTVSWQGGYAIISGEHLPARRTNICTLVIAR